MVHMADHIGANPATHFGRQMRKERLARGWTLRDLAAKTGVNFSHLGRIENGKRPPTEAVADACDSVFPERKGWFREYYEESKSWTPAGFRSWGEYEDKAAVLHAWAPGIIHGLLQTEDYARALIAVEPSVTDEIIRARLASRMERQRRVLLREDEPPTTWFIVDQVALYRLVGSAHVMAEQMRHLAHVASLPRVTLTVMPAVAHPANASEVMITDDAAYTEHMNGGLVYTEPETMSALAVRFDMLRGECYRVSESLALIRETRDLWTTGVSPLTRAATAGPA
jgi:transcriptional regulator with XRE-family HTH domain